MKKIYDVRSKGKNRRGTTRKRQNEEVEIAAIQRNVNWEDVKRLSQNGK